MVNTRTGEAAPHDSAEAAAFLAPPLTAAMAYSVQKRVGKRWERYWFEMPAGNPPVFLIGRSAGVRVYFGIMYVVSGCPVRDCLVEHPPRLWEADSPPYTYW